jgi:hypothetical protein
MAKWKASLEDNGDDTQSWYVDSSSRTNGQYQRDTLEEFQPKQQS